MDKMHKETLQITKEIIVKFIETGRVSPTNFGEIFPAVYTVVRKTMADSIITSSLDIAAIDGDE